MSSHSCPTNIDTTSLVARQPIYARDLSVYGYELLFRSQDGTGMSQIDGTTATSSVLLTAFVDVGLSSLVGSHLAFVNFTREFLVGDRPIPESPDKLVVEILEDITIDDELLAGIAQLSDQGYTIALDDVVFSEMLLPIMDLVDIVKVEYPAIVPGELESHVAQFRQWPVQLLAEKVETREDYEECREAGFDLFQGFFLSRPEIVHGEVARRNSGLLPLLAHTHSSFRSFEELEKSVQVDADLCFRLMRYLNSTAVGLTREITSLRHGLTMLGISGVRRLITLLSLAKAESASSEILVTSLVRATMCHSLAKTIDPQLTNAAYTAGLFSRLDAILNLPLDEILASLPLSSEISDAILNGDSLLGQILEDVIAYESAEWQKIDLSQFSAQLLRASYLDAIQTADSIIQELPQPPRAR